MNRYILILFLIPLFLNCREAVRDEINQNQTFGNTTDNTRISSEKIDGGQTYEIYFTLDKPAECMTIDMESALLQKSFPVQKVPKRTFFYIEKKLNIRQSKTGTLPGYTQLGRNFNNDWELYSPVKICGSKNDPLGNLDSSEYRVRFTAFEKKMLYYIITVTCKSKVIFTEYIPPVKK